MESRSTTLAIDFGVKYIGVALVEHAADRQTRPHNRVLYAATVVAEPKPLKALVENRAGIRRLRRARKTRQSRLRRLSQALAGVVNADAIVRFCRRRGFSHDARDAADDHAFQISRSQFFQALEAEIARLVPETGRAFTLDACARHLNRRRRRSAELRPARFENRGRSRCHWEGCRHNVPRAGNEIKGRLQQSLFLWFLPVFAQSPDVPRLRRSLEHWIDELTALAHAYRRTTGDTEEAAAGRERVNARIRRVFVNLRARVQREAQPDVRIKFRSDWTEYYRQQISEILRGESAGRVRYCREHSTEFVERVLAGQPIPNRQDIDESDLVSRRQQILFRRLARLIEARILPLAGRHIDRLVVERVAFDVLSGTRKARRNLGEEKACEIYWYGPQAGFASRAEMLSAEFAGTCAYCGERRSLIEVEHILHRSEFPFDSYFNIVPACPECNGRKMNRTALEAGMTIHQGAYDAYCRYLAAKPVLHPYHTVKKGILNLLRHPATVSRAQQIIGLIADNLVSITHSQSGPRPLAKYLATTLRRSTGAAPEIIFQAGRHTALYRSVLLPDYAKDQLKSQGDLRNHAVDAIILACDLPSVTALENPNWSKTRRDVVVWTKQVRAAAPTMIHGLPRVEPVPFVEFFEEDAGNGYRTIALSAFNWNRRRKAAHKIDPFGKTAAGIPCKRCPAATVFAELRKNGTACTTQIGAIAHQGLRQALLNQIGDAPAALIRWLQRTTQAGLRNRNMSSHPADRERLRLLETFVATPVADFLKPEQPATIPWVIGIRCLNLDTGGPRKVNVRRAINGNPAAQFYQSEAVVREMYVGYPMDHGKLNRRRPILFAVSQIGEVSGRHPRGWVQVDVAPDSPLRGRPLGATGELANFRQEWEAAFAELCKMEGIAKMFRLTQGCVVEKLDGTQFQLRNFDRAEPWMALNSFKDIHRIHRSPLRVMQ